MKTKLLALMVASTLAAPAWSADTERGSRYEAAGLGSGLAVGAALGGPVGAILGAALGGWFGDRFHAEQSGRMAAESELGQARSEIRVARSSLSSLRSELNDSEQRLVSMQAQIRAEEAQYRDALQAALNAEIFFRTDEAALRADSQQRLHHIAELAGSIDGFTLRLAGHADRRGAEDYNETLSAARAIAVRDALIAAGFPRERITLVAEGEAFAVAAEDDPDALAMDRRVQIEVVATSAATRVARQ